MANKSGKFDYYYANGKKVPLMLADGMFAFDDDEIEARLPKAEHVEQIRTVSRRLRGRVALVNYSDVAETVSKELHEHNVAHPVFEAEGALIVPLPEVRIEESDESKLNQVGEWLRQHSDLAEIVSERVGRIVVKPVSNNPMDALEIANRVAEEVGPAMAQPRFIRCVQRPKNLLKP